MNNKNKSYRFAVRIIIALGLVAMLVGGCGKNGVNPQAGIISEVTMAVAVDENGKPLYSTTVFNPDSDVFFCSFKVTDAPPDTKIKGEWIYVSGEVEEQIGKNYVMNEMTITVEGTRDAAVFYRRPPMPTYRWPKGEYKVVLYVNEKEEMSVPFTVK
jgi:hypothetical protein